MMEWSGPQSRTMHIPTGWTCELSERFGLDAFISELRRVANNTGWLFRGEPRPFPTGLPGVARHLSPNAKDPNGAECHRLAHFQELAEYQLSHHERSIAKDAYGWMMLAQHHGMPTRLLDWTFSAWVAVYFAARADLNHDGLIWCFDPVVVAAHADQSLAEKLAESAAEPTIEGFCSKVRGLGEVMGTVGLRGGTPRMVAQRGAYTIGAPIRLDHRKYIGESVKRASDESAVVVVVPKELKPTLMQELWRMNIHGASLFPGVDGVGLAMRESMLFALAMPANVNYSQMFPSNGEGLGS